MRCKAEINTYHVLVPEIFGIVFTSFISSVVEHTFNLMLLLVLCVRVRSVVGTVLFVKLFKVLNVVYVIRYPNTTTGYAYAIFRDPRLLFLLRPSTIIRIRVCVGLPW